MIVLDFLNVAEIIFMDPELRSKLPDFKSQFDSWLLSARSSALRQLGKRAILAFLTELKDDHLKIISEHLGTQVVLKKIDHHIVKQLETSIKELEVVLNTGDWYSNFAITRNKDKVKVGFWR